MKREKQKQNPDATLEAIRKEAMENLAKSAKAFISATAVAIIELPKIKAKTTKGLHKQMDPLLDEMVDKFIAAQAAAFGYGLFAGEGGKE